MNCALHPDWPIAGTCSRCGKSICAKCEPTLGSATPKCEACRARRDGIEHGGQINGLLIVPAIFLVLSPLSLLTAIGVLGYALSMGARGILSVMLTVGLGIYSVYVAVNFFQRKKRTPMLVISLLAARVVVSLLGLVVGVGALAAGSSLVMSLAFAAAGIPYFLYSQRVRSTFVME